MAVILTDDLFSCINMPKKKKSPKRRAETPQSVTRRLGVIDEEDRYGGQSDEEHPEELARFAELQWRNPVEVGDQPFVRTLPPGVTEANIAGPGQSDPRTRREMVPGSPRTDIDSVASTPPYTYVLGSTDTPTPSASPECWPGDDHPERLAPLPDCEPDHVCDPTDPMCIFPQRQDPEEIITDPRQVGLHVCRPRDPWCQNDHQGPKTDRKMTARMQTSEVYCWCARCNKHWNITCPKQWTGPCADPKRTESGCELPPKVRPPSPASAEPTEFREPLVKTPVDATTAVLHLLIEETRAQAVMARHAERRTQEYFETLQQGGCHSHTNKSATSGSGQRRGYPSSNGTRPTNAWIGGQT